VHGARRTQTKPTREHPTDRRPATHTSTSSGATYGLTPSLPRSLTTCPFAVGGSIRYRRSGPPDYLPRSSFHVRRKRRCGPQPPTANRQSPITNYQSRGGIPCRTRMHRLQERRMIQCPINPRPTDRPTDPRQPQGEAEGPDPGLSATPDEYRPHTPTVHRPSNPVSPALVPPEQNRTEPESGDSENTTSALDVPPVHVHVHVHAYVRVCVMSMSVPMSVSSSLLTFHISSSYCRRRGGENAFRRSSAFEGRLQLS
jgi:hypothetical protein